MTDLLKSKEQQDEKQVKEAEREEKQLALDYEATFSTPHGERVFSDLMGYSKFFGEPMTGNSWTYYNLGMRGMGQRILNMRHMAAFEETRKRYVEQEMAELKASQEEKTDGSK
jgi:hypothetical protein